MISYRNSYKSMEEVLTRRFTDERFDVLPDLIMMDGGRGQVNIAMEVLESLGLSIPVCGMVKDDHHRTRGLYYLNEEIPISHYSEGFKLITRIQDEAHRFAITYHRSLRSNAQVHSILDDIPGVGEARRKALMRHFASIEEIRAASVEEIEKIPSMNAKAAQSVYDFFHTIKPLFLFNYCLILIFFRYCFIFFYFIIFYIISKTVFCI